MAGERFGGSALELVGLEVWWVRGACRPGARPRAAPRPGTPSSNLPPMCQPHLACAASHGPAPLSTVSHPSSVTQRAEPAPTLHPPRPSLPCAGSHTALQLYLPLAAPYSPHSLHPTCPVPTWRALAATAHHVACCTSRPPTRCAPAARPPAVAGPWQARTKGTWTTCCLMRVPKEVPALGTWCYLMVCPMQHLPVDSKLHAA